MLLWILLFIVVLIVFGAGIFVRLFLWVAIGLLIVWLVAVALSRIFDRR